MQTSNLPASIEWRGSPFDLFLQFPRIWTQNAGRPFGLYWSKSLQHGLLHPQPTETELSAFYDCAGYDAYLGGIKKERTKTRRSLIERAIVKLAYLVDRGTDDPLPSIWRFSGVERPTVCDIGCGSGKLLSRMREKTTKVVGIDPSEISGNAVRKLGIEFYSGAAEAIPAEVWLRRFDIVTMTHSLEHCRDPHLALSNVRDLLSPGGLAVIEVPNMECLGFQTYRHAWYHTDAGRHLHFFTPRSLSELCMSVGLKPIATEFSSFTRQFSREWIADMATVWDRLFGEARSVPIQRPSTVRSAFYLLSAIFSRPQLKYDIVRLYARYAA